MYALYTSVVLLLMIVIYVNRSSISHRARGNGFSDGSRGFESSIRVIDRVITIESFPYVFSLMTQIGVTLQV
jgi:hypothetical protein